MSTLKRLFMRLMIAMHHVDAHLARERGDMLFAEDCLQRAHQLHWDLQAEHMMERIRS